jgi:hypothetical protein
MQYKITNIVPNTDTGKMTVFYEFSNGNTLSNVVDIETPVPEIQQWGLDKCAWFDEREIRLEEIRQELLAEELTQE